MLSVLGLFSGIGGFELGLERAGFRIAAMCESDPFCRRVLAQHWPGIPVYDDVRELEFTEWQADVVTGGFPCQDVSCAGKRAGLSGANSGLYRELVRAIRVVRPRHAIVENVAALLGDGMGTVLGDLAESGADAEWDCVPAEALGAPHERDRVFIVAHADRKHRWSGTAWKDRPQVGDGPDEAADATDWRSPIRDVRTLRSRPAPQQSERCARLPSPADPARERCGEGRAGRPPDSFARIRDEARRNAADSYGARLAFREGLTRDAWEERAAAERDGKRDGWQPIWPDEPALSGVDDGIPNWMDRVRATGNALLPQIPELIGRAILAHISRERQAA